MEGRRYYKQWKQELTDLIDKAEAENKSLRHNGLSGRLTFTPAKLRAENEKGHFLWGAANWELIDNIPTTEPVLREELAGYAHAAWSGWMKYLFGKVMLELKDAPDPKFPENWIERWTRLMNTPYNKLTEAEKESDREEADRMIKIMDNAWREMVDLC